MPSFIIVSVFMLATLAHGAIVPVEVHLYRGNGFLAGTMPFVFDASISGAEMSATLQTSEEFADAMLEEKARYTKGKFESMDKQAIFTSAKNAKIRLGYVKGTHPTPLANVPSLLEYIEGNNAKAIHKMLVKDLDGDMVVEMLMVDPKVVIVLEDA